jgi:hypothetical protein
MVQEKRGVSKDEADIGAAWFETRKKSAPHHEVVTFAGEERTSDGTQPGDRPLLP